MTFQDLILKLSAFWASHGCLLQQPSTWSRRRGPLIPNALRVPSETLERRYGTVAAPDDGDSAESYRLVSTTIPFHPQAIADEVQQIYLESL